MSTSSSSRAEPKPRSSAAGLLTLVALVFAVGTVACSQKKKKAAADDAAPSKPLVTKPLVTWVVPAVELELRSARGQPPHELDASAYASLLGNGLRKSPYFAIDGSDASAEAMPPRVAVNARVVAELGYDEIEEGSSGSPAVVVTLEVAILPSDTSYLGVVDKVIVERILSKDEGASDVPGVIDRRARGAINASVSTLIEIERLRGAPPAELVAALNKTPDLAIWALDLIADRRDRSLVGDVIKQFRARDERVASAAITTAVALGDPRAVAPMTKQADLQDYEQLRVLIEACSALGGKDAMEFLEFIASGHADEEIKTLATEALTRLRP